MKLDVDEKEHRVLVLDERHQVHVVLASDDEDSLARRVLARHTLASSKLCPKVCPDEVQSRSAGTQRQPSLYAKTGLKSTTSGLFSGSWWG